MRFDSGILRQVAGALQRFRQRIAHRETLAPPRSTAGSMSSAHLRLPYLRCASSNPRTVPGTPGGLPAFEAVARRLSGSVQIHVARGFLRRALAEIDESGAAVGEADQHESAAAQVAGVGMGHGQRESDGDRRVHGVAAVFAGPGRRRRSPGLLRDHHGVAGANRFARVRGGAESPDQHQRDEQPPHASDSSELAEGEDPCGVSY